MFCCFSSSKKKRPQAPPAVQKPCQTCLERNKNGEKIQFHQGPAFIDQEINLENISDQAESIRDMERADRLEEERKFIRAHIKEQSLSEYLIDKDFMEQYTKYINKESQFRPVLINNTHLANQVQFSDSESKYYIVNEYIWTFLYTLYRGGPEVPRTNPICIPIMKELPEESLKRIQGGNIEHKLESMHKSMTKSILKKSQLRKNAPKKLDTDFEQVNDSVILKRNIDLQLEIIKLQVEMEYNKGKKQKEVKQLKDEMENFQKEVENCIICFDNQKDAIFQPCNHICACMECAESIKGRGGHCPYCREELTGVEKIYLNV